jgi:outer membrane protein assembly factor BamB
MTANLRRVVTAACVSGCVAIVTAQRSPLDYPQWRGRDRDGAASGFVEPASWPETLTRKWKVSVGEGYGTPLVVGSVVYVFTRIEGSEGMTALNADTGQSLWRTGYPASYTPSPPAAKHGAGPKATPLFQDGKLFTLGISGIVAAFDAVTGKLLWKTSAPAEAPYFSAASSPVGDSGIVIVHPGNYGPLTAFDQETGTVKWTAGDEGFFASPVILNLGGIRQVVTATQRNVIGVSVPDGKVLWQYPFANNGAITPVVYGQTIIISGLDLGVAAFKPVQHDGKWITDSLWENKDVSMYLSNPVVIGETVFGLSHRAGGQFFAIDAGTGRVLWLGPPREATNTAIVKAGNLLFLLNDDGELIVARAGRTKFEPVKQYTVAESATWAQPAMSGNRLFIKDVSSLALWTIH